MMKIFMTGGTGLLGTEIRKLDRTIIAPTEETLDINDFESVLKLIKKYNPDVVLHLAANTKPPEHERNPELGLTTNITGTANVARVCVRLNKKLVYTSTDHIYLGKGPHKETEGVWSPYNFGWSKLGGECAVHMVPNHLILRLSFGPVPFPWDKVYKNQFNSKLYVDEMAPLVLKSAKSKTIGILNLGGPRASLEDYAKRTRSDIKTIPKPDWVPKDTSLDISKMKKALHITNEHNLLKHGKN
jgi:dTDP-4-dehydrorhamnose reductase